MSQSLVFVLFILLSLLEPNFAESNHENNVSEELKDLPIRSTGNELKVQSHKKKAEGSYLFGLKCGAQSEKSEANFVKFVEKRSGKAFGKREKMSTPQGDLCRILHATLSKDEIAELSRLEDVLYIEEDGIVEKYEEWHQDRLDQRYLPMDNADYFTTGIAHSDFTSNGAGVNIYVLDTGIRSTHTQFSGRVGTVRNYQSSETSADCDGHGTHVAGIAAGSTVGIAPGATIHSLKILPCGGDGSTTNSIVVEALTWVNNNAVKPCVVNMSIGGGKATSVNTMTNTVVSSKGCVVVVAAGNDDDNSCLYSPSSATDAITVGATAHNDYRAYFSNYGTCVDIWAPGMYITSSYIYGDNQYIVKSGTSMASPVVAGVAARYLSQFTTATPAQVRAALISNALSVVQNAGTGSPTYLANIAYSAVTAYGTKSELKSDERIYSGDYLRDSNYNYFLYLNGCNLELFYSKQIDSKNRAWSAGKSTDGSCFLVMQSDGNAVVYRTNGEVVWTSGTCCASGSSQHVAKIQTDGNFVVYHDVNGNAVAKYGTGSNRLGGYWLTDANIKGSGKFESYKTRGSTTSTWTAHDMSINSGEAWAATTNSYYLYLNGCRLELHANKDIHASNRVWHSGTSTSGSCRFTIQSDGNSVIYRNTDGGDVWETDTNGVFSDVCGGGDLYCENYILVEEGYWRLIHSDASAASQIDTRGTSRSGNRYFGVY